MKLEGLAVVGDELWLSYDEERAYLGRWKLDKVYGL